MATRRYDRVRLQPDSKIPGDRSPDDTELSLDSDGEVPAVSICAGGCGVALGPQDAAGGRAVFAAGSTWCLPCLARGRGPFDAIDDYFLLRRLGRGGMGEVHLAARRSPPGLVAIKILRDLAWEATSNLRRFTREGEIGRRLQHPNIIAFLDSGEFQGVPYLVMEYARGTTVRRLLDEKGRFTVHLAAGVAYQTTRALAHALAADVVHRDIKPDNIVIDEQKRVRLLDMGLAKRMSKAGQTSLTESGIGLGTVHYMAPEQLEDARYADHRADIYSLGVTLYEMLCGGRPFEGVSSREVATRILQGRFRPLLEMAADVPQALNAIVSRAMATDRDHRYQHPDEMGQALSAFGASGRSRRG